MGQELPNDQLAQTISEAAFNPAKWTEVCDGMARFVSAHGGVIVPTEVAQRSLGLPHSAELDELTSTYQRDEWYKRDLRERGLQTMFRRGYMTDANCITYDGIGHSSYYQDFLRPAGLRWFVGINIQTAQSSWVLSLQRSLLMDPFSETEIGMVLAYRGLLDNSAAIARNLGFARVYGASSVLEQHGLCAIALDANERVVHVSPSAEHHLKNDLQINGGKLQARRAMDAGALARLISGICGKTVSGSNLHVSLRRVGGKPPLVLYGCSLPESGCDMFQPAVALLVISDPERQQHIPPGLLMDYFGLTRSEARLAIALHIGASVEQHAVEQGISPVTARNHLQGLLRKTSTHRKSDLIAVLNKVIPRK